MKKKLIKKVLITGHKGFIGFWLSYFYKMFGWRVFGVDNLSSEGERIYDLVPNFFEKELSCSIEDKTKMKEFIKIIKPNLMINVAGQAIVPKAFRNPIQTFNSNTLGTLRLLEILRENESIKSAIFITSDKVYKNTNKSEIFKETDQLEGKDMYSCSKVFADQLVKIYVDNFISKKKNLQIVRLGNVVGGGDWSVNRLVPDLINAIIKKKYFKVRYSQATRPFQHISDVVNCIYKISNYSLEKKIKSGDCWNLGPKNNSFEKVGNVIKIFKKVWKNIMVVDDNKKFKEDLNLRINISKYSKLFGQPEYDSKESINKTIKWYYEYHVNKVSPRILIEKDLELFNSKKN